MPAISLARDLQSEADGVRNTFSSWDACMAESYCKYPAIIAIVIGSLVVISIIWCCARCLCCGAECCCACCSCFNSCCPSPRRKRDDGYQPQGSSHSNYPPNTQYQQPAPMYFGGGFKPVQTATFDAPSNGGRKSYNEDALPAMPSWNEAQSHHVEEEEVELEKFDQHHQQQSLLHQNGYHNSPPMHDNDGFYNAPPQAYQQPQHNGDLSDMHATPYHDYNQHQQYAPSQISTPGLSEYPPTYQTHPQSEYGNHYAASVPPSYQTAPPSVASPTYGRRPVQGSWRDV